MLLAAGCAAPHDQAAGPVPGAAAPTSASGAGLAPAVAGAYDVVAVLGQSNAAGRGGGPDEQTAVDPRLASRIRQWPASGPRRGEPVPATEPLLGPWPSAGTGPATTFARAYVAAQDRPVLLVPAAVDGTGFAPTRGMTWDPDDHVTARNLFDDAVTQVRGALASRPGNRLVAVLWVQGESDVGRLAPDEYRAALVRTLTRFRGAVAGPAPGEVPVVVGSMVPEWSAARPERRALDEVHRSLAEDLDAVAYVRGPAGRMNGPADLIHYSTLGQREQGRRMYAAWRALLEPDPAAAPH